MTAFAATIVVAGLAPAGHTTPNGTPPHRTAPAITPAALTNPTEADGPLVVGHRGASGYRPEHTSAAYQMAIRQGADGIEPDLVLTKDGKLVSRHENEMSMTTNVASRPQFADRKTTKTIDGNEVTGWFTEDFTLKEIKTLRAKERLPELRPDSAKYDGRYLVLTFQDIIDLVREESRRAGRQIGILAELKHSTYFRSIGSSLEDAFVSALRRNNLDSADSHVTVQSFETSDLRAVNDAVDVPVAQIMNSSGKPYDFVESGDPRTYRDLAAPEGLRWVASYAEGVNINKNLIIPRDASGGLTEPTSVVSDAHAANLYVFAWTFRNENEFLPRDFRNGEDPATWGDAEAEYETFADQDVDGFLSDFPDTAIKSIETAGIAPVDGNRAA
ncbi:MAG: glycerophosphodiester phosphodiesterase [Micromonosporaceae bacterium]